MLRPLPRCSKCSEPMRFVRSLPAVARHPELQSFECRSCREAMTVAVDDNGTKYGFSSAAGYRAA